MSAKKDTNLVDSVRNATTGYATVVLGIVCFILVLATLAALTRFVVGIGFTGTSTAATAPTTSSTSIATASATSGFATGVRTT